MDLDNSFDASLTNLLVAVLVTLLAIWAVRRKIIYKDFYRLAETIQYPPDLSTWPLIGHAHHFMATQNALFNIFRNFEKYDHPMKLWIGPKLFACLTRPEDMEICFNKALAKEDAYDYLKYIWSDGLLTLSGPKWKRDRKLLSVVFNQKILDGFVGCFVEKSAPILEYIERQDGEVFDIGDEIFVTVVEALRKTCVGDEGDRALAKVYTGVINEMFEMISSRMLNIMHRSDWLYSFSSDYKRFKEANEMFIESNNKSWAEKLESYRENKGDLQNSTFFDNLARISKNGEHFTEQEILDHIQTFILAGSDATFSTSAFCLLMLAMHPEIQEKVFAEIREVIGTGEITASNLSNMSYTERAIKETLRLFPVAPITLRVATEDLKLEKCTIPKGAGIFFGTIVTHRSEKYYKNSLVFDPDRFLPEEVAKRHAYTYFPFTLGPRKCIGVAYGFNLVKTVVATVVGSYQLETPLKNIEEVELSMTAVLRSVKGFPLRAVKRDS